MTGPGSEPHVASNRRYFTDARGRTWFIERMGRLDEKTVFWIGGSGVEPSAFASEHDREDDFTVPELNAALEDLGFGPP